ncbi:MULTISPECIES: hypothetical protein [unclassified Vibrio]|uniref:hypothetical protein n=1 Tax=unclassified Vibrio TaxID=2614977 RepID=UPI00354F0581
MKVYIHGGFHKTGSTFIQNSLRSQKNKKEIFIDIESISEVCFSDSYFNKLLLRIEKAKSQGFSKYIISNERIFGTYLNGYDDIESRSKKFSECLLEIIPTSDINLLLFVRRQDEFIESSYIQEVHQGSRIVFDEYYEARKKLFDWGEVILRIDPKLKENIFVIDYTEEKYCKNDIIDDVSAFFDCSVYLEKQEFNNVSYGQLAFDIAFQLIDQVDNRWLRSVLQANLNKNVTDKISLLSEAHLAELKVIYKESNLALASKYEFTDSFLNIPSTSENKEHYSKKDVAKLASTLVFKIEQQQKTIVNKNRELERINCKIEALKKENLVIGKNIAVLKKYSLIYRIASKLKKLIK